MWFTCNNMDEICKNLLKRGKQTMSGKITGFLREYILTLSIIITIIGFILFFIGVLWYWIRDVVNNNEILSFINELGEWNAYLLIGGIILLFIGLYYLYSYFKNRKFVLKELQINKRSELLKKHKELHNKVKRLPTKYQKLLKEKEEELNI